MTSPEQVLITRIRQGEAAAWQRLIDEYEGRLLAFATRRLRIISWLRMSCRRRSSGS